MLTEEGASTYADDVQLLTYEQRGSAVTLARLDEPAAVRSCRHGRAAEWPFSADDRLVARQEADAARVCKDVAGCVSDGAGHGLLDQFDRDAVRGGLQCEGVVGSPVVTPAMAATCRPSSIRTPTPLCPRSWESAPVFTAWNSVSRRR